MWLKLHDYLHLLQACQSCEAVSPWCPILPEFMYHICLNSLSVVLSPIFSPIIHVSFITLHTSAFFTICLSPIHSCPFLLIYLFYYVSLILSHTIFYILMKASFNSVISLTWKLANMNVCLWNIYPKYCQILKNSANFGKSSRPFRCKLVIWNIWNIWNIWIIMSDFAFFYTIVQNYTKFWDEIFPDVVPMSITGKVYANSMLVLISRRRAYNIPIYTLLPQSAAPLT